MLVIQILICHCQKIEHNRCGLFNTKGIPSNRFQLIDGKGQNEPVSDNNSASGKAKTDEL
jgi:hypothetical protein